MALAATSLPYGMREVYLYPFTGETPAATGIKFPNARTLSFSEAEDTEELRGDDGVVAVHGSGPSVDWELEGGGINFEAVQAMYGGTVASTGVSPAAVKTYTKKETDQRGYFMMKGRAISDSGGDFVVTLFKCKATGELSGELADQSFWLTGASGRAIGRASDRAIYEFAMNETAAELEPA